MCDNVSVVFPTHCISRAQAFTVHFVCCLKCNIKYTCRPKELMNLGLGANLYGMHSFRVGRNSDLIKYQYSLEEVKRMGRWCSNTIYKYIKLN